MAAVMKGRPSLMMPAFSPAIFRMPLPRTSSWSSATLVTIERSGSTTFVESSLPPNPTSRMARSTIFWLK